MLCPFKKHFRSLQNPHGIHSLLFTYRENNTLGKYFYNGPNNSQLPFLLWQNLPWTFSGVCDTRKILGFPFLLLRTRLDSVQNISSPLVNPIWGHLVMIILESGRTSVSQNLASKYLHDSPWHTIILYLVITMLIYISALSYAGRRCNLR